MTIDRMIELLKIEHECMLRKSHDGCTDCLSCDLVQDDAELHEMYTDVIAFLKAKQARLLTKEEVVALPDHAWIEFRRSNGLGVRDRDDIRFLIESKAGGNYGITWRCWTQQPSEEDRKKVGWNDKNRPYAKQQHLATH